MSRLQVGGLALIIKAENPDNLGVVVKLVDKLFFGGYEGFKTSGATSGNFSPRVGFYPRRQTNSRPI